VEFEVPPKLVMLPVPDAVEYSVFAMAAGLVKLYGTFGPADAELSQP